MFLNYCSRYDLIPCNLLADYQVRVAPKVHKYGPAPCQEDNKNIRYYHTNKKVSTQETSLSQRFDPVRDALII